MKARELDVLVAEKVMGLCFHSWSKRIIPSCIKCGASFMKIDHAAKLGLPYSTDRNAAALVMQRLEGLHLQRAFERHFNGLIAEYWGSSRGPVSLGLFGKLMAPPHLICEVALKCVGVDPENNKAKEPQTSRDATGKCL